MSYETSREGGRFYRVHIYGPSEFNPHSTSSIRIGDSGHNDEDEYTDDEDEDDGVNGHDSPYPSAWLSKRRSRSRSRSRGRSERGRRLARTPFRRPRPRYRDTSLGRRDSIQSYICHELDMLDEVILARRKIYGDLFSPKRRSVRTPRRSRSTRRLNDDYDDDFEYRSDSTQGEDPLDNPNFPYKWPQLRRKGRVESPPIRPRRYFDDDDHDVGYASVLTPLTQPGRDSLEDPYALGNVPSPPTRRHADNHPIRTSRSSNQYRMEKIRSTGSVNNDDDDDEEHGLSYFASVSTPHTQFGRDPLDNPYSPNNMPSPRTRRHGDNPPTRTPRSSNQSRKDNIRSIGSVKNNDDDEDEVENASVSSPLTQLLRDSLDIHHSPDKLPSPGTRKHGDSPPTQTPRSSNQSRKDNTRSIESDNNNNNNNDDDTEEHGRESFKERKKDPLDDPHSPLYRHSPSNKITRERRNRSSNRSHGTRSTPRTNDDLATIIYDSDAVSIKSLEKELDGLGIEVNRSDESRRDPERRSL